MEDKPVKVRLHFFNSTVTANSKLDYYIWELKAYPHVLVQDFENEIQCHYVCNVFNIYLSLSLESEIIIF